TLTQNINEALELAQSEVFAQLIELAIKTEECFSKTNFDPSVLISKQSALLKEKKNQLLYLQLLMIYYEDVLKMKLGKSDDIRYKTYETSLTLSESKMTQAICLERIKALLETEKRIQSNGNVLLCLDRLFLQMKGGI
ncbi:MAG TPA: DNA polymerase III subunit delta', partial [Firmicutes bacterium]|nr:DNA polymerase III subunit delta' [Bacillota bacterium]